MVTGKSRRWVVVKSGAFRIRDVRGNVDTRLRKLDEQNLDAIILAEAGLVDAEIALEGQQAGRDHAARDVVLEPGHRVFLHPALRPDTAGPD